MEQRYRLESCACNALKNLETNRMIYKKLLCKSRTYLVPVQQKCFFFVCFFLSRTSICSMNYFLYSQACLSHLTGCVLPIVHNCFESSWWVYTWSQGAIFVRKEIYPHIIMSVRFQFERPLVRYKEREERENV